MRKKRNFSNITPYIIFIAISLFAFFPIFRAGPMVYGDHPTHLAETHFVKENIYKDYHWINGWSNKEFAGYPILLYKYQLGHIVTVLLSNIFSLELSYKIIVLLTIIFLQLAIFSLLSYLYPGRNGKVVSMILSGFITMSTVVALTMIRGMWNNFLAISFLLLFLKRLFIFMENTDLKQSSYLTILLVLIIFSHHFTTFVALIFLLSFFIVYLITNRKEEKIYRNIFLFLAIPAFAFLISLIYIMPIFETRTWLAAVESNQFIINPLKLLTKLLFPLMSIKALILSSFSQGTSYHGYVIGIIYIISTCFLCTIFFILVMTGFINIFKNKVERLRYLPCFLSFILCGIIAGGYLRILPFEVPFLKNLIDDRFMIYLHILLIIFALNGIKFVIETMSDKEQKLGVIKYVMNNKIKLILLISFVIYLGGNVLEYNISEAYCLTYKHINPEIRASLNDLWKWENRNINTSEERVIYKSTFGLLKLRNSESTNRSHLLSLGAIETDVSHIGGWCGGWPYPMESVINGDGRRLFGRRQDTLTDMEIADHMKFYNAKHIVTVGRELQEMLEQSQLFSREFTSKVFVAYVLRDYEPCWFESEGNDVRYSITGFKDYKIEADVTTVESDTSILCKFSYHPYWKAFIDGNRAPINNKDNLMALTIANPGEHRVKLVYDSKQWGTLVVSLVTLISLVVVNIRAKIVVNIQNKKSR